MPAKKSPTKKSLVKKAAVRKKSSRSIVTRPRFSKRALMIFGAAFAVIGAYFLFRIFAAPIRVDYFGQLTADKPTVSYKLTTGTGNMDVTFSNNTADVTLTVKNSANRVVGTIKSIGKTDVKKTFSITADTYTISLATSAKFNGKKGYSIHVTYPSKDIVNPTAIISSPLNSTSINGTVSFAAYAQGAVAIDRIEFYVDGNLLKSDITTPYSVPLDTTKYSNGNHTLSVKSYDIGGRVGEASGVIEVSNTTPPPPPSGTFDTSLLRPAPGKILLGANEETTGYPAIKALHGKELHIWHGYSKGGAAFKKKLAEAPTGTIPLINFKPGGVMGPAEYKKIIAGDRDGEIKIAAAAAKAYGKKFFFSPMHEPENDDKTAPYVGDADYAKAFTHVINLMKSEGANNIVVTWNVMGFKEWVGRYDKLYPGDGVVDWIASDPYNHNGEPINDFGSGGTKLFYAWASKHNKPMMWAEWGLDGVKVPGSANAFFSQAGLDALQRDMPLIQGLVYWSNWEYLVSYFPNQFKAFTNFEEFNFVPPASVLK